MAAEECRWKCYESWLAFNFSIADTPKRISSVFNSFQRDELLFSSTIVSVLKKLMVGDSSLLANLQYDVQMLFGEVESCDCEGDLMDFIIGLRARIDGSGLSDVAAEEDITEIGTDNVEDEEDDGEKTPESRYSPPPQQINQYVLYDFPPPPHPPKNLLPFPLAVNDHTPVDKPALDRFAVGGATNYDFGDISETNNVTENRDADNNKSSFSEEEERPPNPRYEGMKLKSCEEVEEFLSKRLRRLVLEGKKNNVLVNTGGEELKRKSATKGPVPQCRPDSED